MDRAIVQRNKSTDVLDRIAGMLLRRLGLPAFALAAGAGA
jgi:hypothetical protein